MLVELQEEHREERIKIVDRRQFDPNERSPRIMRAA
jgi:hypothetical protein